MLFVVIVGTGCHYDGQDLTNTHYNGYVVGAVYRLQKQMELAHDNAEHVPSNYRICDNMPPDSPYVDGILPSGTRIRFAKTVWAASHEGGGDPVAYGAILDPPFASKLVNLCYVSDERAEEQAKPDTNILAIVQN